MKSNTVYLQHILRAAKQIDAYVGGHSREEFLESPMLQDAVIRQLEIIGEASNQLSPDFQEAHDEIPWAEVIGMRNRLIHDYLGVDLDIIWEVVQNDLPDMRRSISRILGE